MYISIVIPVSPNSQLLSRAVQSVLDSTLRIVEVVVVDGTGCDSLPPVCNDSRVQVVRSENSQFGSLLNLGQRAASGHILGFLNPEDMYYPQALEQAWALFQTRSQLDFVYGRTNSIDYQDRFVRRVITEPPTLSRLANRPCLHPTSVFYQRRTLKKFGQFNENLKYWCHYDYWLRMAKGKAKFGFIPQFVGYKRAEDFSRSDYLQTELERAKEALQVVREITGKTSARWALAIGRITATMQGADRGHNREFDEIVLSTACSQIDDSLPTLSKLLLKSRIYRTHFFSEMNRIRTKPSLMTRFFKSKKMPVGVVAANDKQPQHPVPATVESNEGTVAEAPGPTVNAQPSTPRGYRLFQLHYHEPQPCLLPESYFKNVELIAPPKISIATPNLNQGIYLERTILSVLQQSYPSLELVVQDGCSTDNSLDVIRHFQGRLTAWESVKDTGQSQAINFGLCKTNGEIMAYLNSDDTLVPGSLSYVANYFRQHPDVDVIYGNRLLIDEYDQVINYWVLPPHDPETLQWADYVPQETMFWRRRAWDAVGGKIDESFRFAMDWDLILRFQRAGMVFHHVPRFLGAFRITVNQKTSQQILTHGQKEMNRLRERELGYIPSDEEVQRNVRRYMSQQRDVEILHDLGEMACREMLPYREWVIESEIESRMIIPLRKAA